MKSVCKYIAIVIAAFLAQAVLPALSLAAPVDSASKYVESLGNDAVATLTNKDFNKEKKREKIEKLFRENVDIAWVGRFAMGRFWRQATDDQKKRYLKEYETFLTEHYATRFSDYSSGSFSVVGAREDGNNEFTISMKIQSGEAGSQPVLVDYRVRKDGKKEFIIFDIIIEGVSMITAQRSEFSSVITSNGIDYLISQLASKAAEPVVEKK